MASSSGSDTESSHSSSEDDFEEFLNEFEQFGIQPYQFEPQISDDSSIEEDDGDNQPDYPEQEDLGRLQDTEWCKCENCQVMDTNAECVCCQEVDQIMGTMLAAVTEGDSEQPPTCITQHPGFLAVCTNKWILRTAWYQYKQQYTDAYEGPEHKQYRHIAYRQFVRWCWGLRGKDVRVVLPSCAVMCIRQHFPPPGLEDDFVFEGFHFADE